MAKITCFQAKKQKVGKFGVFFFQGISKSGKIIKYLKPNFPIKVWRSNAFTQNLFFLEAIKLKCDFFLVGESFFS